MTELTLGSLVAEDSGGTGPALVMIHGLGGTSNTFQPQMPFLDGFRVLRPDLPGAGRTALRPGLPGLKGLGSAVRDLMRAAGVERAHFAGHSMGTLICQYIAVETPDLVDSLTLFGPILEPSEAARIGLKDRASTARSHGMTGIADAVSRASVSEGSCAANPIAAAFVRESLMRQNPAGYATHCEALSNAHAADHSIIRCPTLLIAGEKDPVAPVAMAQTLAARIEGATLEVMAGIGHWMTMENPTRSGELLRDHVKTATAQDG